MYRNKHLTHRIDWYNFLGHEQDTAVYESCIMANCEARRWWQDGRSDFHHTRSNPCERVTPCQNEARVSRRQVVDPWYWPRSNSAKTLAHKYRFLRQGITLTGLQTPTFMKVADAIQLIHSHFDWQFQEGTLEEYAKDTEGSDEIDQISMWNRYFTPVCEANDMQALAFLPGVDPTGTLRKMAQEGINCTYIHTEDNQVHYFKTCRDSVGNIRWVLAAMKEEAMTLIDDAQIQMMRTTGVPSRGHCGSAGFLHRNTNQGRLTQDANNFAVISIDQREFQKSKDKTHPGKCTTNIRKETYRNIGRICREPEG